MTPKETHDCLEYHSATGHEHSVMCEMSLPLGQVPTHELLSDVNISVPALQMKKPAGPGEAPKKPHSASGFPCLGNGPPA